MSRDELQNIAKKQCRFFLSGKTKEISFRIQQLNILKRAIEKNEARILDALHQDLGKAETEAYTSDIAQVLQEIGFALDHIHKWAKPKKTGTPFLLFPASSCICPEPHGVVLIIGAWNYPFQLTLSPLVAAMAAGNCAVVKPSENAPSTSMVIAAMLKESFVPEYISAIEGGAEETQALLAQHFDYLFFTGGTRTGKIIMEAAAKHLTPVTLELGGKNPCIVDGDCNVEVAARRIAWGKFLNAGQTCVAPDYLMVHASVKHSLLEQLQACINSFYGADPFTSPDYGRIVNDRHFSRLTSLLHGCNIVIGGQTNREQRYIAPTVVDNISWDHPVMGEEIFGPIMPVLEYEDLDDVIEILKPKPKPLALYFFSNDKTRQEKVLQKLSSGGICINDTLAHLLNQNLPFGGVGDSGIGAYHGKFGFDTFTHYKAVVKRAVWADPKIKYPPYKTPLKYLKTAMKLMS